MKRGEALAPLPPSAQPLNILWAGPIQAPESMLRGTAPHPATMRWQRMFIEGLRGAGHRVRWVGHEPHRTWPWGPLRVTAASRESLVTFDRDASQIAYTNLNRLRKASLRTAYRRATSCAMLSERPDAVVTYNADAWMQGAADAAAAHGVPWIPIILDFPDPLADGWAAFRTATGRARGLAFVSHWAIGAAPVTDKHLICGAIVPRPAASSAPSSRGAVRTLLYAGWNSKAGGLDRLLAALGLLRTRRVRLVITGHGKGLDRDLQRACDASPMVEHRGMVPEAELEGLAFAADVLVNPRPIAAKDSRMNFPSKLLDYLSYQRPIVSTRAPGIGPEYEAVIVFTRGDAPGEIAEALDSVLGWTAADLDACRVRMAAFARGRPPVLSAGRFADWIACLLGRQPAAGR